MSRRFVDPSICLKVTNKVTAQSSKLRRQDVDCTGLHPSSETRKLGDRAAGTRIVTASYDKTARIWRAPGTAPSAISLSRGSLIDRTYSTPVENGLDHLSNEELAAAPDLDPKLDVDACHPPTLWARLRAFFREFI